MKDITKIALRYVRWVVPLMLAGCASTSPNRSSPASHRAILIAQRSEQADVLWESAKEVLRDHGFRIDRSDRGAGVMTTMPRTSQQVFEFWRNDVRTSADLWEATLNPVRRWTEVQFVSDDSGGWRELQVIVHKERFSSPDRQFNNTGAAYQFFGDQLPSTTGASRVTSAEDRWLDTGRDLPMEDHLARTILARAGLAVPPSSSDVDDSAIASPSP